MKKNRIIRLTLFIISLCCFVNYNTLKADEIITVNKELLDILPNGRTTGSVLENWLAQAVFFQVESGGLSRADLPRFSSRGISWIEQNYRINGIDITDPWQSGYPLFEPAWESIKTIELRSARENDPYMTGLNWQLGLPAYTDPVQFSYNNIFPTSNASPIPEDTFDREPSFEYGSPGERRRYKMSHEINAAYNETGKYFIGIEALNTQREFPTLTDESGNMIEEKAGKYKITGLYNSSNTNLPYMLLFIGQYSRNNNYGANLRLDHENTATQENITSHLQYQAKKKLSKGRMTFQSGITTKFESLDPHPDKPREIEFDSESGPVPDTGSINRINFDNNLNYKYKILNINAGFQINSVIYEPDIPYSQTMNTDDGSIYSVTIWEDTAGCTENVYNTKLKTGFEKAWDKISLSGNVFADNTNATANGNTVLNWFGIGGKLSSTLEVKKTGTAFDISVLHQPSKISSYLVAFLNNERPSGKTYINWFDANGNNIADNGELASASLYSTTGGEYHHKDKNLKRPYHDEISLGVGQNIGKDMKISLNGTHRIFSRYFIVNYETYDGTYTDTGDGYTIYNKQPGEDQYYLSNYEDGRAFYSGADIQFLWQNKKLYLNIAFTMFMVKGFAPIGNGPDYNDYAVISENTASPNSRINSDDGRLCSDRAYMGNILFAYKIRKDLSAGITMKYRDGEPFAQYRTYYDSNGMPVKVMNQERGDWYNQGTGRYTFSWNMDIRIVYKPAIWDNNVTITLDVSNLLGSSTEILESYRLEDERRALEAVPQRMIMLGIDIRL